MEEPSSSTSGATVIESGLMEEIYGYEVMKIDHMEITVMDDDESGFPETSAVIIEIIFNRFTPSSPAVPETMATELFFLDGFFDDDEDDRLNDLNNLVRNRKVSASDLEEIKKEIMIHSSSVIKEIANEVKRPQLLIEIELNLLSFYSHEEEGENAVAAGEMVNLGDGYDEDMFDIHDEDNNDNDVGTPALPSSVEELEKTIFQTMEELEKKIKKSGYTNCLICLNEFMNDDAPATTGGIGMEISLTSMPCSHIFHTECIVSWLRKRCTCPICRYEMPTATAD